MKKMVLFSFLVLSIVQSGFPAGDRTPSGGRSMALGGTSVARYDIWSLGNNQAGTAWLNGASCGLSFENHFLLKALMYEQIGFSLPLKAGTFGLLVNRFGNSEYNESKVGFSFARKFGKHFSAGVQIDYLLIHVTGDYGNKNLVSCEIGLMYQADQHLCIGVQLVNPVPVKITEHPNELMPTIICIGLSYGFSADFSTSVEAEKDPEHPLAFRAGAEYHLAGPAFARIGISTSPMSFTFGAGLKFGKLTFDIASGYHQALGFSPSGSLVYSFK